MRTLASTAGLTLIAVLVGPSTAADARFDRIKRNGVLTCGVDADKVRTNIVIFDVGGTGLTGAQFSSRLQERGVLANPVSATSLRMVTHFDVSRDECETALAACGEIAGGA